MNSRWSNFMSDSPYLTGQLLLAMPSMLDTRFSKTVIYMCAHNEEGAMGLVVNRELESLTFPDLLNQLGIEPLMARPQIKIHFGGPVDSGRGFVLHTADYTQEATVPVDDAVALTTTMDILQAIAEGDGPDQCLLALGYAGWGPGQLDAEIKENGWLHVTSDDDLVFGPELDGKWERGMGKLGIDPRMLSDEAGHA
jgi:putative transcriptional regulator